MATFVLNVNGANYPLTIRDQSAVDSLWRRLTEAWVHPSEPQRWQEVDIQSPNGGRATLRLGVAGIHSLAILTTADDEPGRVWGY